MKWLEMAGVFFAWAWLTNMALSYGDYHFVVGLSAMVILYFYVIWGKDYD